jgi:phosphatidyl-myo-inositol dimannoside synthase
VLNTPIARRGTRGGESVLRNHLPRVLCSGVRQRNALCIAAQTFQGSRGGIARVCELTARVAFEADYPLSLLSVQNEGGLYEDCDFWQGFGGSRAKFVAACGWAALRGKRILFDQLGTARAHIWPSKLTRPSGAWIHGIEVWDQLRPDRLRAASRMAYMLANTDFTRERAIRYDKIFESARVCWLATFEDDPPKAPANLDGPPIVLILGRLDDAAYKGHKELIEVWPTVADAIPGARLVIAGTGPSLDRHRSLVAASQAASSIHILGFVPDSALPDHWKRTVVFAMPSRGEGFGLSYIEAMRWGIPVIASTCDAGQEVNIHNETGLNVDLDKRNELRDSLVLLLRDRDLARRMGAAGQSRWRNHFCYSAFRKRFLQELSYFAEL